MEWTEEHDVLMLREMLSSGVFSFKKGSVSRGEAWDSIAEKLNEIESPKFLIKDKRGVRDRWLLLGRKWKIKIRNEESASGIAVGEQTEKEALIEELVERENSPCEDSTTAKQKKDKETGEDMRKKAMETMGQTKKRKSSGSSEDDDRPRKKKTKRCSEPLIHFLQEKASAERDLTAAEIGNQEKRTGETTRDYPGHGSSATADESGIFVSCAKIN